MAIDPALFLANWATPHTPIGAPVDFSSIGRIGDRLANAQVRKEQVKANEQSQAIARQKLALDAAKFQQKAEFDQMKMFSDAYQQFSPDLVSGAPGRADTAMAGLRAAGGQVSDPFAPSFAALSPLGDFDIPEPGQAPEGGPSLDGVGELELDSSALDPFVAEGRETQQIADPFGRTVLDYDQQGTMDENVLTITGHLQTLADQFGLEYPVEAGMLSGIAESAARGVLSSPGGTIEKAVGYATDLLTERLASRDKNLRASMLSQGQGGDIMSSIEYARGQTMARSSAQQYKLDTSVHMVNELADAVGQLELELQAYEKNGTPIDMSYFNSIIYSLARSNDPGAKLTDKDMAYTFDLGTVPEMMKNFFAGKAGVDLTDVAGSLIGLGAMNRDGTVSGQTAKRLRRTLITRLGIYHERLAEAKDRATTNHKMMLRSGTYGAANGYAGYINGLVGNDMLSSVRPEDFVPGALRPGQPAQAVGMQGMAGASRPQYGAQRDAGNTQAAQTALDALTGAPPGQGYVAARQELLTANPQRAAQLNRAIEQFDAAQGFDALPTVTDNIGVMEGELPKVSDVDDPELDALLREYGH